MASQPCYPVSKGPWFNDTSEPTSVNGNAFPRISYPAPDTNMLVNEIRASRQSLQRFELSLSQIQQQLVRVQIQTGGIATEIGGLRDELRQLQISHAPHNSVISSYSEVPREEAERSQVAEHTYKLIPTLHVREVDCQYLESSAKALMETSTAEAGHRPPQPANDPTSAEEIEQKRLKRLKKNQAKRERLRKKKAAMREAAASQIDEEAGLAASDAESLGASSASLRSVIKGQPTEPGSPPPKSLGTNLTLESLEGSLWEKRRLYHFRMIVRAKKERAAMLAGGEEQIECDDGKIRNDIVVANPSTSKVNVRNRLCESQRSGSDHWVNLCSDEEPTETGGIRIVQ